MEHQFLIKCYILSSLIFLQRKKFVVLVSALLFCILFIDPHQAVRIPGTQKYWICKCLCIVWIYRYLSPVPCRL